jgi:hypothetical protein
MKNSLVSISIIAIASTLSLFSSCGSNTPPDEQKNETTQQLSQTLMSDDALIQQGEHLVKSMACADCHCPKKFSDKGMEADMDLWLSGHPADSKLPAQQPQALKAGWLLFSPDITAFVGPWGTSYAANLTPDTATGIGAWKEETFFTAIKKGKFHGAASGRDLLPPMPWQWFQHLEDDELRAIFLYLKSIKPIKNAVPAPLPPSS